MMKLLMMRTGLLLFFHQRICYKAYHVSVHGGSSFSYIPGLLDISYGIVEPINPLTSFHFFISQKIFFFHKTILKSALTSVGAIATQYAAPRGRARHRIFTPFHSPFHPYQVVKIMCRARPYIFICCFSLLSMLVLWFLVSVCLYTPPLPLPLIYLQCSPLVPPQNYIDKVYCELEYLLYIKMFSSL